MNNDIFLKQILDFIFAITICSIYSLSLSLVNYYAGELHQVYVEPSTRQGRSIFPDRGKWQKTDSVKTLDSGEEKPIIGNALEEVEAITAEQEDEARGWGP